MLMECWSSFFRPEPNCFLMPFISLILLYFIHFGSGTKNSLSTVRWVRMDRSRLSALLFMFIIAFGKLRKMGQ